jgi:hypothetical protein
MMHHLGSHAFGASAPSPPEEGGEGALAASKRGAV